MITDLQKECGVLFVTFVKLLNFIGFKMAI